MKLEYDSPDGSLADALCLEMTWIIRTLLSKSPPQTKATKIVIPVDMQLSVLTLSNFIQQIFFKHLFCLPYNLCHHHDVLVLLTLTLLGWQSILKYVSKSMHIN